MFLNWLFQPHIFQLYVLSLGFLGSVFTDFSVSSGAGRSSRSTNIIMSLENLINGKKVLYHFTVKYLLPALSGEPENKKKY
jgi:hypothetical protein